MKIFLSIFFSIHLFVGGLFMNDMEEVFKMPALISHYFDHKAQANEDFDILDFLVLHYGYDTDHASSSDNPDLPFYQHNFPALTFTLEHPANFNLSSGFTISAPSSLYSFNYSREIVRFSLRPPRS